MMTRMSRRRRSRRSDFSYIYCQPYHSHYSIEIKSQIVFTHGLFDHVSRPLGGSNSLEFDRNTLSHHLLTPERIRIPL